MKVYSLFIVLTLLITSCSLQNESVPTMDGSSIIEKSKARHDPDNKWDNLNFHLHIQEPRLLNPSRYSKVKMNNGDGSFELQRNREEQVSRHVIDEEGNAITYLDDREETNPALIQKYRLSPDRNEGYRNFYKVLYGLPMSLASITRRIGKVETAIYNKQACYKIPVELKEKMFSNDWVVYIAQSDFQFKGMEILFPSDISSGERLYFEGEIIIDGVSIPRIRHWYEYANGNYSGSDIIIKELSK